jgi:hypothetical protein
VAPADGDLEDLEDGIVVTEVTEVTEEEVVVVEVVAAVVEAVAVAEVEVVAVVEEVVEVVAVVVVVVVVAEVVVVKKDLEMYLVEYPPSVSATADNPYKSPHNPPAYWKQKSVHQDIAGTFVDPAKYVQPFLPLLSDLHNH